MKKSKNDFFLMVLLSSAVVLSGFVIWSKLVGSKNAPEVAGAKTELSTKGQ